jgi:hypothetical protein
MPCSDTKPIGVPVSTAIHLVGQSEHTVRRRIAEGVISLLPGSIGRKRVSIAGLEQFAGRPFTIAEIETAEQRAAKIRSAYLAAKHARASKKAST